MTVRFHAVLALFVLVLAGVAAPVWAGPLEDAQALMSRGQMPRAEQLLRAHIAANPGDRQARMILAGALAAQRKLDEAYAEYQALLDENASDGVGLAVAAIFAERGASADDARRIEQLFPQVQQAMQARDFERAVQVLDEIVRLVPGNTPARTNLAQILIQLNRQEEAVGHLEEVFRLRPKDAEAGTRLAEAYERMRENGKARDTYQAVLKYWPKHQPSLFAMGRLAFFGDRDYAAAADWFTRLIQVNPRHAEGGYLLGLARAQVGDREGARAAYQQVVNADPTYFKARFQLALMLEEDGRDAEALAAFQDVIKHGGDSSEAQQAGRRIALTGGDVETARIVKEKTSLSVRAMEAGDLATAQALLEEILALVPNNVLARYNLATVYSRSGNNDKAAEQLEAAIAVDPQHFLSHYGLALIYQGSGQFEQAYASYQQVLKWAPRDDPRRQVASVMVGELKDTIEKFVGLRESRDAFLAATDLAQKKDFEGALREIGRAIKLDPTNPYYHYNAAIFYWETEQIDQSYKELREAVKYKPDHVQSHFRLGLFFLLAGVAQEAVASFEKVIEYGTDEPEVAEARRRLEEVRGTADGKEKAVGYLFLGQNLARAGRREDAAEAYKRAYQLDPSHRNVIRSLAETLIIIGKNDEALYYLNQGLRRDEKYFPYYPAQAQALMNRGDLGRAEQALLKGLEINPKHRPSILSLVRVYEELERVDEALDLLGGLIDENPDDVGLLLAKGRMLSRHDRNTEAAALYDWYLAGHDENVAVLVDRGVLAEKVTTAVVEDDAAAEGGTAALYATPAEWFQRAIAIAGPQDAKLVAFARSKLAAAKKWRVRLSQNVLEFNTNANNSATDPTAGASSAMTLSITYTPFRTPRLSLPLTFTTNHRLHYTFQTYVNTTTLKGALGVNFSRLNLVPEGHVAVTRNAQGTTGVNYVGSLTLTGRIPFPKTSSLAYTRTEFVSYLNPNNNYLQELYNLRLGHDFSLGKATRISLGSTMSRDDRVAVAAILDVTRVSHNETLGFQRTMSEGRVFNLGVGYSGSHEDRATNYRRDDPDRVPVPIVTKGASVNGSYAYRPYPRVTATLSGSYTVTRFLRGQFSPFPVAEGDIEWREVQQDRGAVSASLRFSYQASDNARWDVTLSQVESRTSIDIPTDLEAELTGNIVQDNINKQQTLTVTMNYTF